MGLVLVAAMTQRTPGHLLPIIDLNISLVNCSL